MYILSRDWFMQEGWVQKWLAPEQNWFREYEVEDARLEKRFPAGYIKERLNDSWAKDLNLATCRFLKNQFR